MNSEFPVLVDSIGRFTPEVFFRSVNTPILNTRVDIGVNLPGKELIDVRAVYYCVPRTGGTIRSKIEFVAEAFLIIKYGRFTASLYCLNRRVNFYINSGRGPTVEPPDAKNIGDIYNLSSIARVRTH